MLPNQNTVGYWDASDVKIAERTKTTELQKVPDLKKEKFIIVLLIYFDFYNKSDNKVVGVFPVWAQRIAT